MSKISYDRAIAVREIISELPRISRFVLDVMVSEYSNEYFVTVILNQYLPKSHLATFPQTIDGVPIFYDFDYYQ